MKLSGELFVALTWSFFFAANFYAPAQEEPVWPNITSENRPWTWWWWHGSAVDETNLARELREFHAAGLGGVQITAIYGVRGAEARDIPYLSPRWLHMMGYTVTEASNLDMGVTMTLGTGWCFGGPTVGDEDANASVVVKTFSVAPGKSCPERFDRRTTQALVAFSPDGQATDLTGKIAADGGLNWSAPRDSTNSWIIYAISQKPSGQKVKRAAPGGEGWMLNPLYPPAVTDWLKWFDDAFAHYHGAMPQAVFQDSYEYRTDWAPDFFAQFQKLRGYKLQNELPWLFANESQITNPESRDHIARVKYDYRRTASEIMAEESEPAWINWAHRRGFQTIYQAHGTPGNWLDLYADADLPETEMFHKDRSILISKFASSAADIVGRKFTGAETGTWLAEHFTETLAELKSLADDMFLAGVNRIFYHGTCYSPADAPWPGWLFYASTEMNPRNSIWHDVPALNAYVARCQSILQAGRPDNDILLYWPVADFWSNPRGLLQAMTVSATDWFKNQPIGQTAEELWNNGYSFDYVSDAQLLKAKVAGGKIQMPGGDYRVLVVPPCHFMPLKTFRQLLVLAQNGATVIFEKNLPQDVPGWGDLPRRRAEFERLKAEAQAAGQNPPGGRSPFGQGAIFCDVTALAGLQRASVPRESALAENGLSFIRRAFAVGWNYFIANRGTNNFDGWIALGRPARFVVLLDPMNGSAGVATRNSRGQIRLQLAAGQSVIVRALDHPAPPEDRLPIWNYFQPHGAPTEVTGIWHVKFIAGGPTLPADTQISRLASWTTFPDTNCQAFGGTARYEITFNAPALETSNYFLDLGDVRQSARVKLNGKDYGTLFMPPFHVVVDNLKPAGNRLEVEVTSVDANRIRDLDRRGVRWKIFKDINFVDENYRPFNAANWPLTDCGLLGPVTLIPAVAR